MDSLEPRDADAPRNAAAAPAVAFFDVDGTLTYHRDGVPEDQAAPSERVCRALEAFTARGNIAVLCTGRPPITVSPALRACPFTAKIMLAGGCVEFGDEVVHHEFMPRDLLARLVDELARARMSAFFETSSRCLLVEWPETPLSFDIGYEHTSIDELRGMLGTLEVSKVVLESHRLDLLDPAMPFIREDFVISNLGVGEHEITLPSTTKRSGMQVVLSELRRRGVQVGTVYGFGDSENDVSMLEAADVAVVMGNALPQVRAYADYVTDTVQEDGVATALEHFGLV
ncbi:MULTISPECIES: HAD-IIB family hydrolase [Enorma]|uniref:Haloacid dehalogenase n=1 Tax=[Collinsella] massiliensis TaxID=1232426 RepID=A0A1Y3XML9_9ACTN|nr:MULTISPECIES: HAD family hydrolase [Enorma]OUN86776.1 hypothetical protein B5G02_08205 [[Collinsella] massiliensis]